MALDMYVLGQGIKTGVYRVCDELFPRLLQSDVLRPAYFIRPGFEERITEYVKNKCLPQDVMRVQGSASNTIDALLSPFGVAPAEWTDDLRIVNAHIIYDLIAINKPEYFTQEAIDEVHNIISSLDRDSVIFAISEYTKKDLLSYRWDLSPEQVTVIPLGVGDRFYPCDDLEGKRTVRQRYRIPENVPYILSLATLEIRKNLDGVVASFVRYLDVNPESDLHLVLSGMTGWKLDSLDKALATSGRWRQRIILTGFVEDEDLAALYSEARCFIYLSRYEGFGLPPLEAMACGTPVICANNSSLPEVVGDAGVMVGEDDIEGVAQAIRRILSSDAYRHLLSTKGIERARLFDWDSCARIVRDKLIDAIDAKRSPLRENISVRQASFLGYDNGSKGPIFQFSNLEQQENQRLLWPNWTDRLPPSPSPERLEGGLRCVGQFKFDTPEKPLISYVTVVRNNASTLERTITSVQSQTYTNIEHIVLDGASSDGTIEVIERYRDKLDYYVSEPDNGLYDALNKAIPLARGRLICVLNSDDWLEPDAAEIVVSHMRNEMGSALLLSGARVLDGSIVHEWMPAFVHPGSYFMCANDCHNAIYATRKAYEESGPYDAGYKIAADFKWIMGCLVKGVNFIYTTESTVNYSLGGTSSDQRKHGLECMRVVHDRFPFLSLTEIKGLFYCFFVFRNSVALIEETRPMNCAAFIRQLFVRHVNQPDFLAALSWASIVTMDHASDRISVVYDSEQPSFVKAVQRRLIHYPRLYGISKRLYMRIKRG
ncbi:glycosyltransferase [Paracandidimonas lactea]|uniref:glycosyltransferase n=1 Tax=Paracandidimonas lactea TaxID=2895524 RepID=UPI001F3A271D